MKSKLWAGVLALALWVPEPAAAQILVGNGIVKVQCDGRVRWGSASGNIDSTHPFTITLTYDLGRNVVKINDGTTPTWDGKPLFIQGKQYPITKNDFRGAVSFVAEKLAPNVPDNNAAGGVFLLYPDATFGLTEAFDNGMSFLGMNVQSAVFLDGTCHKLSPPVAAPRKRPQ
ncbi:hypothetical protein SAMN05428974_0963 [Sphingopyxis sp. YR583]|uniref:hypothetical protein n=1 Tax=Sphingopyxis sp. YR583 TaxID=1881047 RepID=UPI0008A7CF7C|nr:hypothetical protein [Sphingopyxis sp. YR583]SEH13829.1 hypothetical protein SAMN05428974_0963 [Sphingopyxis sp. YR583]